MLERSPSPDTTIGTGKAVALVGVIGLGTAAVVGGASTVVNGVKNGIGYSVDGVRKVIRHHDDDSKHEQLNRRSTMTDDRATKQRIFKRAPVPLQDDGAFLERSIDEDADLQKVSTGMDINFQVSLTLFPSTA